MTGTEKTSGTVHCRRLGRALTPDRHLSCSYCNGDTEQIATGEYERFCDFDPEKLPVSFGFPDDGSRLQRG